MLPLVKPVASVRSDKEVPAIPFLLKIGAAFSIMNCLVRSALFGSFVFMAKNIPIGILKVKIIVFCIKRMNDKLMKRNYGWSRFADVVEGASFLSGKVFRGSIILKVEPLPGFEST